jgi:acyl-CoA thioesterase-2
LIFDPKSALPDNSGMQQTTHKALRPALLAGLDSLLGALELERLEEHRFRAAPDIACSPGRVYGGQLLAQALVAAATTTPGKSPLSMHAAFVRPGTPGLPLEAVVDPVRDGRTMATRQVTMLENGKALLTAIVSCQDSFRDGSVPNHGVSNHGVSNHGAAREPAGLEPPGPAPSALPPEALPPEALPPEALPPEALPPEGMRLVQDWARQLPGDAAEYGRHWIEQPPPVEMRLPQAPSFLGGSLAGHTRSHWMRAPRDLGAAPLLNAAVLAYASDFFLMDMVFHAHPVAGGAGRCNGLSLDHAIWFHRPVRFDRWHLYTQETVALAGERGLARGTIHDAEGRLTATVMQEVLVLPVAAR